MITPTELARCLGDETRMSLMCLIAAREEVCVCELVDALGAPQSTISRHLAQLRRSGLATARRDGTWMHYRLNPELPGWARDVIDLLLEPANRQFDLMPGSAKPDQCEAGKPRQTQAANAAG